MPCSCSCSCSCGLSSAGSPLPLLSCKGMSNPYEQGHLKSDLKPRKRSPAPRSQRKRLDQLEGINCATCREWE
ncbi:hypothetical protein BJX99DRAFT_131751 [Aspergillus californicus]